MSTIALKSGIKLAKASIDSYFDLVTFDGTPTQTRDEKDVLSSGIMNNVKSLIFKHYKTDSSIYVVPNITFHKSIKDVLTEANLLFTVGDTSWMSIEYDGEFMILCLNVYSQDNDTLLIKSKYKDKGKNTNSYKITVYTSSFAVNKVKSFFESLLGYVAYCIERTHRKLKDDESNIFYLVPNPGGGFDLNDFVFKNSDFDLNLDLNYGDGFTLKYKTMIQTVNKFTKGVCIFSGIPGSGKTFLIRYMFRDLKRKLVIYVPPQVASMLSDPSFSGFCISKFQEANSNGKIFDSILFVVEDCEQLLKDRRKGGSHISTILNFSDGIFNDIIPVQFLFTYNNSESIDQAILRDGRLIFK
jgi:hypothetical protein